MHYTHYMHYTPLHERFNQYGTPLRERFNEYDTPLRERFNEYDTTLREQFYQYGTPLREWFNSVYRQGCGKAAIAAMMLFAALAVSLLTRPGTQTAS